MLKALPVLAALSLAPVSTQLAPAGQKAEQPKPAADSSTVQCPLTGQEIPSCCCPVKK